MASQRFTADDQTYMKRALVLAARGQGRVEPNPMVGCVIAKGKNIVGEGYHRRFGGPHAEIHALRAAGPRAKGATAYITLEPCSHHGKTPPCTDALIEAGVKRVVVAMRDPFPQVRGRGLRILRSAGIKVVVGPCETEAKQLNAPFLKVQRSGKPWVILKWAQSLDGKIATRTGDSKWISSEQSRRWAHRIRGRVDGIIVGVGTVLADDPELTCRHTRPKRIATRIILDPKLRTPKRAKLLRKTREVPTLIVTERTISKSPKAQTYKRAGVEILGMRRTRAGLDLAELLNELGRRGMTNVMIEGGGKTLGAFFDAELADEAIVFVSPKLIGGQGAASPLAGRGINSIDNVHQPVRTKITRCGPDHVYQLGLVST